MSTIISLNSVSYTIPAPGDDAWGAQVSAYLIALATGVVTKAGGPFTLTSELDFGATYGLKSAYYKSRGTNIAATGILRMASAESIVWRNNANSADLALTTNASDQLVFNSNAILSAALASGQIIVGSSLGAATAVSMSGDITISNTGVTAIGATKVTNAMLSGSIAYSKLVLTGAILNADLAGSIAYSKLSLSGSILNSDLAGSIAYSKLVLTGAVNLASDMTGTLPIGNGGTGQTTANAALNALLPSQTSQSGKVLTTDGSNSTWTTATGLTNPMTTIGDIIVGGSSGAATRLGIGASNTVLKGGTTPVWASLSSSDLAIPPSNVVIGNASTLGASTNVSLLGDIKASTNRATVTMTIATPAVVTLSSHGLATGDKVFLETSGALPTGLSIDTTYWAVVIDSSTFNLSTTLANAIAGTKIATSGTQSGTHTIFTGGLVLTSGLKGAVSNTSPVAGYLGELISSSTVKSVAVSVTANTPLNICSSITLTPGIWDLSATGSFLTASTTSVSEILISISKTSATLSASDTNCVPTNGEVLLGQDYTPTVPGSNSNETLTCPQCRVLLSTATTFYFVGQATFTASTLKVFGSLQARRVA